MVEVSEHIDKSVIMTQQVGDFNLHVVYTSKRKFEITVTKMSTGEFKTSVIDAVYEPIFGVDVDDMTTILAEAEALCEAFEAESQ